MSEKRCLLLFLMFCCFLSTKAQEYRHQNEILLWPEGAPGSSQENWPWKGYKHEWRIDSATGKELSIFVTEPTIQVFLPPQDINTGTAVVVCPGGGYNVIVIGKEGYDISQELNSRGIAAIVLNYRHYNQAAALQDAHRALQYTRFKAKEWKIDPNRVGIGGFSAGGHLAIQSAVDIKGDFHPDDSLKNYSTHPNFLMLIYPAVQFPKKEHIARIPPSFIAVAGDDGLVHAAVDLYKILHRNNIPAALHIYQTGGHGFGAGNPECKCNNWFDLFNNWLIVNDLHD